MHKQPTRHRAGLARRRRLRRLRFCVVCMAAGFVRCAFYFCVWELLLHWSGRSRRRRKAGLLYMPRDLCYLCVAMQQRGAALQRCCAFAITAFYAFVRRRTAILSFSRKK